jgi:hypothetical protein
VILTKKGAVTKEKETEKFDVHSCDLGPGCYFLVVAMTPLYPLPELA